MNRERGTSFFASLQWFMFMLGSSIAFPIIIGQLFGLSVEEISGLMQRTFLVVGIASFIGGWIGHRLPIVDGPAGIWVGIFILLGQLAVARGDGAAAALPLLEGSMVLAGALLLIIGAAGWMRWMLRWFTPMVNGVYLIILSCQLSGVMLQGMAGSAHTHPGSFLIAFGVFVFVLSLSIWGRGWLKSFSVLIGMCAGWAIYAGIYGLGNMPSVLSVVQLPDVFAWGGPRLDTGTVLSTLLVTAVLVSSVIVGTAVMQQVVREMESAAGRRTPAGEERLNQGGIANGISNILSGVFSTIGVVPFATTTGFVRITGDTRMGPFLVACVAFAAAAFFPAVYSFLSLLPGPVASGAMLALFSQMVGIGVSSVLKEQLDQRRLTILGLSLSIGMGVMFLPQELFAGLPPVLQYVLSSGVMVGIILSLSLEQLWKAEDTAAQPS